MSKARRWTAVMVFLLLFVVQGGQLIRGQNPTIPTRTPTPGAATATDEPSQAGGGGTGATATPSSSATPTPTVLAADPAAAGTVTPTATSSATASATAPGTATASPTASATSTTNTSSAAGSGDPATATSTPEAATPSPTPRLVGADIDDTVATIDAAYPAGAQPVAGQAQSELFAQAPGSDDTPAATPSLLPLLGLVLIIAGLFVYLIARRRAAASTADE